MLKKAVVFATLFVFIPTLSYSSMEQEVPLIEQGNTLTFCRHIAVDDLEYVQNLPERVQARLGHSDPEKWFSNLLLRQESNPYSALIFFDKQGKPQALMGFGIMPHLGYDPKFTDIIDFFLERGVIRRKAKEGEASRSYKKEDLEQVENYGIGYMLPLIFEGVAEGVQKEIVQVATDVFISFKTQGWPLPRNACVPKFVMSLLKTDGQDAEIRKSYLDCGFTAVQKPGFKEFYHDDRVALYLDLEPSDETPSSL